MRAVRLAERAAEKFVVQVSQLCDHIAARCHQARFPIRPAPEAVQFPTLPGLVTAGEGIPVVPSSLRHLRLPGLPYARLDAVSRIGIVCRPDRANLPLVARFFELSAAIDSTGNGFALVLIVENALASRLPGSDDGRSRGPAAPGTFVGGWTGRWNRMIRPGRPDR